MKKQDEAATNKSTSLRVPDYLNESLTQLPLFIKSVLNGDSNSPPHSLTRNSGVDLSEVKNVVIFLVDGFGYTQWKKYSSELDMLQLFENRGLVKPIDTVFPSSTPVALTTIQSGGLLPAEHGLVDWWLYIQEIDSIIGTLPFVAMGKEQRDSLLQSGVSPKILFNGTTFFESLTADGIESYVYIKEDYAYSAYSNLMYKAAKVIPHVDISSLFSNLGRQLNNTNAPSFSYVYWGDIDATGHALGLYTKEYDLATKTYFEAMNSFITEANTKYSEDTLFIITADHGQVSVDLKTTLFLDEIKGFNELLRVSKSGKTMLPWGGPREVFVALKKGSIQETMDLLSSEIGDKAELIRSLDALKLGLFGRVERPHPDLLSRTGDVMVLPKSNYTVWYHHPNEKPFGFKAHHGGLSEDELQVPFAILRTKGLG